VYYAGGEAEGYVAFVTFRAKEVAMNENVRAILYGSLILAVALLPPMISLIELIRKFSGT